MARAIWTGSTSFGLVTIPVGLFSATEDHTIHFHQFERGTGDRIRNHRMNERTGAEIDYSDIVKGTEVGDGVPRRAREDAPKARERPEAAAVRNPTRAGSR